MATHHAQSDIGGTKLSVLARSADRALLAVMLADTRRRTLALLDAYTAALGDSLIVPRRDHLNPPL